MARNSHHRPAVVLRLSQLQVLDGVDITLEERTRVELINADPLVRTLHIMHAQCDKQGRSSRFCRIVAAALHTHT